jgi:haloacetate dehalogenase
VIPLPRSRTHRIRRLSKARTITRTLGLELHSTAGTAPHGKGTGPALVLLHGFPQTHLMWRHVAANLAKDHTVICPDLRGYGGSDKPTEAGASTYSKRTMAADIVVAARALGHHRFALAGHDRGALVAIRAGLDHPGVVSHLLSLDVLPTLTMWEILQGVDAKVAWHLYLMAQPAGVPEPMIEATADTFFASFLDGWVTNPSALPDAYRAEYLRASREAIPSIVADYRASAGIDLVHDREDREAAKALAMPVTSFSRIGVRLLAMTLPRYGVPGRRTLTTARFTPVISWPRKHPKRSSPRCANSSPVRED